MATITRYMVTRVVTHRRRVAIYRIFFAVDGYFTAVNGYLPAVHGYSSAVHGYSSAVYGYSFGVHGYNYVFRFQSNPTKNASGSLVVVFPLSHLSGPDEVRVRVRG